MASESYSGSRDEFSDKDCMTLANLLDDSEWEHLGLQLKMKSAALSRYKRQNSTDSAGVGGTFRMLIDWKKGCKEDQQRQRLSDALQRIDNCMLAEQVQEGQELRVTSPNTEKPPPLPVASALPTSPPGQTQSQLATLCTVAMESDNGHQPKQPLEPVAGVYIPNLKPREEVDDLKKQVEGLTIKETEPRESVQEGQKFDEASTSQTSESHRIECTSAKDTVCPESPPPQHQSPVSQPQTLRGASLPPSSYSCQSSPHLCLNQRDLVDIAEHLTDIWTYRKLGLMCNFDLDQLDQIRSGCFYLRDASLVMLKEWRSTIGCMGRDEFKERLRSAHLEFLIEHLST